MKKLGIGHELRVWEEVTGPECQGAREKATWSGMQEPAQGGLPAVGWVLVCSKKRLLAGFK